MALEGFSFDRIPILPADPPPPPEVPVVAPPSPRRWLDRWARLYWDRGRRIGSYRGCGFSGFFVGLAAVIAFGAVGGVPRAVVIAVAVAVPVTFLVGVKLSQLVFGYERIVFFQQALLASGMVALSLALLGHRGDVARGLDLAALGIGIFLGFGRMGCFMVGCCHGRPARFGVRYSDEHGDAGFPRYLVGRRIFPLQLVDSAISFAMVAVALAVGRGKPGAIACTYFGGYAAARFVVEWFRGDPLRWRLGGVSEAQWTATALLAAIAVVTRNPLAIAAASSLAGGALLLMLLRRTLGRALFGLADPWHVAEVARLIARADRVADAGPLRTSLGLGLSLRGGPAMRDYLLSFPDGSLGPRAVARLVRQIDFGADDPAQLQVVAGATPGLVHVLVTRGPA